MCISKLAGAVCLKYENENIFVINKNVYECGTVLDAVHLKCADVNVLLKKTQTR